MHKTDLIWGGTANFWGGMCPPRPPLGDATDAQRECILELYVTSFTSMNPLFMRHNHYNYARWRIIYIAEMKQLPEEINEELVKGDFVVKCSTNMFNQVDPNHTQEWLNYTEKALVV